MSSTTKTNKLGLSQFLGTDVPDWRTDYNSDMGKIDKEFQDAEENILDTAEEIKANTYEKKYAGASGVQELFSEVSENLNNRFIFRQHQATDISVQVGAQWTEILAHEPTDGFGSYLVIVQMAIPNLSSNAVVTVGSNSTILTSNTSTILANSQPRRIQSVGYISISNSTPKIKVNAYSSVAFTCTDARIMYLKVR